jgi:hypothetical protein
MIDLSPELRRRIKVAAARRDLSVREYVARILEDVVPAEENASHEARRPVTQRTLESLLHAREAVMRGRRFDDDSTDLLREARAERMEHL